MLFNTFLVEYKRQAALHTPAFWARLQEANLTLIASTENAESPIDPMEAQAVICAFNHFTFASFYFICSSFRLTSIDAIAIIINKF